MTEVSEQPTTPGGKKTCQGAIAQLGERLLCTQEVGGSIPPGSTISFSYAVARDKSFFDEAKAFSFAL